MIAITIYRRRASLIPQRGMGVRADLERLREVPRVTVSALTPTGPESARLQLVAASNGEHDVSNGVDGALVVDPAGDDASTLGLEFLVALNETDPGWPLLHEWIERQCVLGFVIPPDSHVLRLRCLEDLQPLTLRCLDRSA